MFRECSQSRVIAGQSKSMLRSFCFCRLRDVSELRVSVSEKIDIRLLESVISLSEVSLSVFPLDVHDEGEGRNERRRSSGDVETISNPVPSVSVGVDE